MQNLSRFLVVELLGHRGWVCSTFQDNVKLFSNSVVSAYVPIVVVGHPCCFTFFLTLGTVLE